MKRKQESGRGRIGRGRGKGRRKDEGGRRKKFKGQK